jgi:hypothetical protein
MNLAVRDVIARLPQETVRDFDVVNRISLFCRGATAREHLGTIQTRNGGEKRVAKTKTDVRWNQDLIQLDRFLEILPDLRTLAQEKPNFVPPEFITFIQQKDTVERLKLYQKVLRDLLVFSDFFSGETYATLSLVAPAVALLQSNLRGKLRESTVTQTAFQHHFYREVAAALEERFSMVNSAGSIYQLASAVHPHHGKLEFIPEEDARLEVWSALADEVESFLIRNQAATASSSSLESQNTDGSILIPQLGSHSAHSIKYSIDQMKTMFFNPNINWTQKSPDPTDFWKENLRNFRIDPHLGRFALGLLSTPASSVPSERNNSAIAALISDRRHRLKSETCANLLAIRDYVRQPDFSLMKLSNLAWEIISAPKTTATMESGDDNQPLLLATSSSISSAR